MIRSGGERAMGLNIEQRSGQPVSSLLLVQRVTCCRFSQLNLRVRSARERVTYPSAPLGESANRSSALSTETLGLLLTLLSLSFRR